MPKKRQTNTRGSYNEGNAVAPGEGDEEKSRMITMADVPLTKPAGLNHTPHRIVLPFSK